MRAVPVGEGAPRGPTDEQLLAELASGDPRVAGRLYDRLLASVDRAILRVMGRREQDHDDLVQAAFEQIVLTLIRKRFAGACALTTWASAIASHIALNALRSRRRQRRVFTTTEHAEPPPAASVDGEGLAHARTEVGRVRTHLAAMRPERAEAVWLHDVLGHELAEMSIILGVSVAAAQSRLVRGRRELLSRMGASAEEGTR